MMQYLSLFLPATLEENSPWYEFPAFGRDDMIKQMISTRARYLNYNQYAVATIDSLLPPRKMKDALKLSANYMASSYIENKGNGHFSVKELPYQAQFAPLCGMVAGDFDNDGNFDVLISGNDYGAETIMGRYDAMNSLLLKGDGKGNFKPLSNLQSGVCINGDAKGLIKLRKADGGYLLAATQNKGPLLVFQNKHPIKMIPLLPDDVFALVTFKNGRKQKIECYYGSSFLSQSARFFELPGQVQSCIITNSKNISRQVVVQ